jgi:hypothetical protein
MRLYLPYGYWEEGDGAKVLFSRDYKPLWRLRLNSVPERVDPSLWVRWRKQQFLWEDASTPWRKSELRAKLEAMLVDMGVQTLPILADALPLLVNEDSLHNFAGAAELLTR